MILERLQKRKERKKTLKKSNSLQKIIEPGEEG
jgi:hypothetical protein